MTDRRAIVGGLVDRFEDAWQSGPPPDLASFLRAASEATGLEPGEQAHRALLIRLVKLDLEYRWRAWSGSGGERKAWRLADYAARLPEVGPPERWPDDLIVAEYKNRRLWGDEPDRSEYLRALGPRAESIRPKLLEADRAIADLGPPEALRALRLDDRANRAFAESLADDPADRPKGAATPPGGATEAWTEPPGPSIARRPGDLGTTRPDGATETRGPREETVAGPGRTLPHPTPDGSRRPEAGRTFGDYELIEEVGRGGMGVVYKAREIGLNRTVALKLTFGEHLSGTAVRRFKNEAEAAGKLDHPNIVPVYRSGQHDGHPFYAMGFVEGSSLSRKIAEHPLPQLEAAELTWTIARAVAYAHSQGVVHRDLKPGNVLMTAQGQPKVADFGLAKMIEADGALTMTGEILGTPSYMAPEQAEGRTHDIGPPADIYALGAILYCTLTGRPPFQAATTLETLSLVKSADPVSPRKLLPRIGRDLETICLKCLAKSPAHRYESASAMADDLRRFLDHSPILARPPRPIDHALKFARRHKAELASLAGSVAAGALLLAIAVGAWRADRDRRVDALLAEARSLLDKAATAPGEEADPLYEMAIVRLGQAEELDPGSKAPDEGMTRLYVDRCRRAIKEGKYETARALILPIRNLGRDGRSADLINQLDREAAGTARVKVGSTPPGSLVRLAAVDADAKLGPTARIGTTPVPERDMAPGNYLFTFTHPGQAEVRAPVLIARGATLDVTIDLPRPEDIPPGMVYVPGGPFLVGDPQSGTAKVVSLPPYYIDRTEVTGADYEKFVAETNSPPPDGWSGSRTCPRAMLQCPVYNVSWYDAYQFAHRAGKRLPTGLEWEKAARGVDGRPFPWGTTFDSRKVLNRDAYFNLREGERDLLVGRRPGGASPYGCLDMAGGVWEWTLDRERPGEPDRVIRGGAYHSRRDDLLTFRAQSSSPGGSDFGGVRLLGFRCVKPAVPGPPLPDLTDALTTGPDLAEAAEYYAVTNRHDKMIPLLARRLLALNPRSIPGNYWKAAALHGAAETPDAREYAEALIYSRRTFLQRPKYKVRSSNGGYDTVQGQVVDLLNHIEKGTGVPSDRSFLEAEKWFDQAEKALNAGRHDEARTILRRVLALDPENEVAVEQMAMIEDARGNPTSAASYRARRVESYRLAVVENPEDADLRDQFAEFLLENGFDLREATDQARKAIELAPSVARYRLDLARCFEKAADWKEALAQSRMAVDLDPEDEATRERVAVYQARLEAQGFRKP